MEPSSKLFLFRSVLSDKSSDFYSISLRSPSYGAFIMKIIFVPRTQEFIEKNKDVETKVPQLTEMQESW